MWVVTLRICVYYGITCFAFSLIVCGFYIGESVLSYISVFVLILLVICLLIDVGFVCLSYFGFRELVLVYVWAVLLVECFVCLNGWLFVCMVIAVWGLWFRLLCVLFV